MARTTQAIGGLRRTGGWEWTAATTVVAVGRYTAASLVAHITRRDPRHEVEHPLAGFDWHDVNVSEERNQRRAWGLHGFVQSADIVLFSSRRASTASAEKPPSRMHPQSPMGPNSGRRLLVTNHSDDERPVSLNDTEGADLINEFVSSVTVTSNPGAALVLAPLPSAAPGSAANTVLAGVGGAR